MKASSTLLLLASGLTASAQSFVSPQKDVDTVLSEKFPGSSISYKEVNNICETTEGVKSYSGYVNLPSDFIPDAAGVKGLPKDGSGHFHFWYFEARNDPENAPTVIWLGGGPGYSGYDGSSVFPCYFNPDSNSTRLNEHSWNNNVNMLYVDQPLGVGFSYTKLGNGTLDLMENQFAPKITNNLTMETTSDVTDLKETSMTKVPATMHINVEGGTTNGTMAAARTFWRFSQVWFNDFPEYQTKNDEISFWGVSYAGFYTTMFTSHFLDQNKLIKDKEHTIKNATTLNLSTVGIINGLTDLEAMAFGFLDYAMNNTYDHPLIEEKDYTKLMKGLTAPKTGCLALVQACRAAQDKLDPEMKGIDPTVNKACIQASTTCIGPLTEKFPSPYYQFDISIEKPSTFPEEYEAAFFNQPWVQEELGVPLNFTRGNDIFTTEFFGKTGDVARYDLSHLGSILDSGLNVAMVYGDRDYRCNWYSAENASLHIPFDGAESFAEAGYADLLTNTSSNGKSSHKGGLVREYGGLSFSRVFQAGHSAGAFQPETFSKIFERAMFRKDVATGMVNLAEEKNYHTLGKSDVRHIKNELPDPIENICYVLWPGETCTKKQRDALEDGTAETKDWIVISPKGTKGKRVGKGTNGDNDNGSGNSNDNDDNDGGRNENGGVRAGASLIMAIAPIIAPLFFI